MREDDDLTLQPNHRDILTRVHGENERKIMQRVYAAPDPAERGPILGLATRMLLVGLVLGAAGFGGYRWYAYFFGAEAPVTAGTSEVRAQDPQDKQISEWVSQLGNPNLDVWNAAELNLAKVGQPARKALEAASKSGDANVERRAKRLMQSFQAAPILKKVSDTFKRANGFEADVSMKLPVMGMPTSTKGRLLCSEDPSRMRMEGTMQVNGQSLKLLTVYDGKTVWNEINAPAKKVVQKGSSKWMRDANKVDPVPELYTFTEVGEATLSDGTVWIVLSGPIREDFLEAKVKLAAEIGGPAAEQAARAQLAGTKRGRLMVDKSSYVTRRIETQDANYVITSSIDMQNVKLGPPADASAFSYTPPKDAQLIDMDAALKGKGAN